MATKAQYPYHGGQPKAGAGAGAEKSGRIMNQTHPSTGETAPPSKANQYRTPPVKSKK